MKGDKQEYPGQWLDMWANVLQGKDETMAFSEDQRIVALAGRVTELESKVRLLEQRVTGHDEQFREMVREVSNQLFSTRQEFQEYMNNLKLNTPSLQMFLELKKQVEELKERLGE